VTTQISGPHFSEFLTQEVWAGTEICISAKFPGGTDAAGRDHILETIGGQRFSTEHDCPLTLGTLTWGQGGVAYLSTNGDIFGFLTTGQVLLASGG
jgi:hypothetical protein